MKLNLEEYNCNEYLEEYYSLGLFHATECYLLYSHEKMTIDYEKSFLRIGEVYDDCDLIFGYRKNENGIWGHYNRHFDGKFQFVSNTLKEYCEGWYQKNNNYWNEQYSEQQWKEIRKHYKLNIDNYKWDAEPICYFIDYCLSNNLLTNFYIKAYRTMIGITLKNGFSTRSFTKMVYVNFDREKEKYFVYFKKDFFDYDVNFKTYDKANFDKVVNDVNEWIINSV